MQLVETSVMLSDRELPTLRRMTFSWRKVYGPTMKTKYRGQTWTRFVGGPRAGEEVRNQTGRPPCYITAEGGAVDGRTGDVAVRWMRRGKTSRNAQRLNITAGIYRRASTTVREDKKQVHTYEWINAWSGENESEA